MRRINKPNIKTKHNKSRLIEECKGCKQTMKKVKNKKETINMKKERW